MIADLGAVTFGMLFTKETGTLFYGIYLWVIVGNGIRYGTQSLVRSQILGLLGFSAVILLNDYWSAHTTLAIGLLLTMILIPLYTYKLLERLNQAVIHAEEANKAKSHFLAKFSRLNELYMSYGLICLFQFKDYDLKRHTFFGVN